MKRLSFLALFTAIMLCMGGIGASADAVKNGDSGIFHQMVMQSSSDPSADRPVSFAGAHDMEMMIDAVDAMVPINGRATFFVSVRGEQLRYQWQIGDLERGVWRDISAQDVDEIEGERTNTLCFRADETLEGTTAFRCLISDSLGHTVESAAAHLCIIPGDNNVIDAVKFGADYSNTNTIFKDFYSGMFKYRTDLCFVSYGWQIRLIHRSYPDH